jgi:hypothetical protein
VCGINLARTSWYPPRRAAPVPGRLALVALASHDGQLHGGPARTSMKTRGLALWAAGRRVPDAKTVEFSESSSGHAARSGWHPCARSSPMVLPSFTAGAASESPQPHWQPQGGPCLRVVEGDSRRDPTADSEMRLTGRCPTPSRMLRRQLEVGRRVDLLGRIG